MPIGELSPALLADAPVFVTVAFAVSTSVLVAILTGNGFEFAL